MSIWIDFKNILLSKAANHHVKTAQEYAKYPPQGQQARFYTREQVNEEYHKAAQLHKRIGLNFAKDNQSEKAIDHYNKAIAYYQNRGNEDGLSHAYALLAFTYCNINKFQDSLTAYDKALSINPTESMTWGNKAWCLYNLQRYQEAEAACAKSLQLNPQNGYTKDTLGCIYRAQGRYQEALDEFKESIKCKKYKDDYEALYLYNKGSVLVALGDIVEANSLFETADKMPLGRMDTQSKDFVHAIRSHKEVREAVVNGLLQLENTTLIPKMGRQLTDQEKEIVQALQDARQNLRQEAANTITSHTTNVSTDLPQRIEQHTQKVVHAQLLAFISESDVLTLRQELKIQGNSKETYDKALSDYYDGFVFSFTQAYNAYQNALSNITAINTSNLAVDLTSSLLTLVPVVGTYAGDVTTKLHEVLTSARIEGRANKFTKLSSDPSEFNLMTKYLILEVITQYQDKIFIEEATLETYANHWWAQVTHAISKFCEAVHTQWSEVQIQILGERFPTKEAKLGHKHAKYLIDYVISKDFQSVAPYERLQKMFDFIKSKIGEGVVENDLISEESKQILQNSLLLENNPVREEEPDETTNLQDGPLETPIIGAATTEIEADTLWL